MQKWTGGPSALNIFLSLLSLDPDDLTAQAMLGDLEYMVLKLGFIQLSNLYGAAGMAGH